MTCLQIILRDESQTVNKLRRSSPILNQINQSYIPYPSMKKFIDRCFHPSTPIIKIRCHTLNVEKYSYSMRDA